MPPMGPDLERPIYTSLRDLSSSPSIATMSQNLPTADSSSNYQVIFDNALKAYKTKTGKDLKSDPLLHRLETCNSPDAVLILLRRQIPGFDQPGSSDEKLTNWVNPVVNVLYNFSQTIGGAVALAYPPAGVIITGISSLLSAVLAASASQSVVIDLFERIEIFFTRLGIYVELPPTVEMTDIIVKVMVDVLLILALVTREIKQGKIKRLLKKLIGRSDIKDALQRFDNLTQGESRMAVAQGLKATHGVGNDVRNVGDGVNVAINKVDAVLDGGENMTVELQQVARVVSDLAKDASDEKRNQMRQDIELWLSPADPFINFNTANDAHYEGTAEWFTQCSVFKSWKESGSLLWIHGKPGSGKSVLSSTIIQDINGISNTGTGHLAFFFFDFKDSRKQDARALLSSIIVQLSNRSVGFFDVLHGFYAAHRDGKHQPSIGALTQCVEDMLKVPEELPIYLIIDAIDECPNTTGMPSSRDQVMALLERLVTSKLPNLHICVTSRPEADIRTFFEPLTSTSNTISLHDESGQKKDIINFVTSMVRSDRNMRRWREADKELVINTLSEKADGMFRWVFCQLETLRPCLPSSVWGILAELPESLDATYERILQEIPKPNRVHAHRLLQCLTAAVRPLAVEELAEVLAIDFDVAGGIPKLNRDFRWADQEQAVLSACSSLIVIVSDENSRRVQFSHFSVKEFLSSDRLATSEMAALRFHHIYLESAHAIMAQACLGVLLQLDDSMDKNTIEGYPLARYAGRFFVNHAEAGDVLSQNNDGVDHLLDSDRPHFNPWLWLQCGDIGQKNLDLNLDSCSESEGSSFGYPFPTYPPRISPLYYTVRLGHQYLTRHLILKHPHDLGPSDIYGGTPLHFAIWSLDFEGLDTVALRNVQRR
ncbi:hypothetical protein F5888DRAFT_418419 [Russula emetica]|nr:hypothetical protein F5888DRAFT_418419 [Russula emetica]